MLGTATIASHGGKDAGLAGAVYRAIIGSTVGSLLGVYLIGNLGEETASYWVTLLGSVTGMAIFLAISPNPDYWPFWTGLYALPTMGGIIGFNLTRRYEVPPESGTAIINFKYSQMKLTFPTIDFRSCPSYRRTLIQNIDLERIQF